MKNGTEKQIKWAEQIRTNFINYLTRDLQTACLPDKFRGTNLSHLDTSSIFESIKADANFDNAKFWIDNRNLSAVRLFAKLNGREIVQIISSELYIQLFADLDVLENFSK